MRWIAATLIALAGVLAGCGPGAADDRRASEPRPPPPPPAQGAFEGYSAPEPAIADSYAMPIDELYSVVLEVTRERFKSLRESRTDRRIHTAWHPAGQPDNPGLFSRMTIELVAAEGATWKLAITGEASDWKPGSPPDMLESRPGWLDDQVTELRVAIDQAINARLD